MLETEVVLQALETKVVLQALETEVVELDRLMQQVRGAGHRPAKPPAAAPQVLPAVLAAAAAPQVLPVGPAMDPAWAQMTQMMVVQEACRA